MTEMIGTISSRKMNTGPHLFFGSTFATHRPSDTNTVGHGIKIGNDMPRGPDTPRWSHPTRRAKIHDQASRAAVAAYGQWMNNIIHLRWWRQRKPSAPPRDLR
jgi:hypothetical protein